MKAQADFRMTMILERQDALRREALRSRLASTPWDGFTTDAFASSTELPAAGAAAEAWFAADVWPAADARPDADRRPPADARPVGDVAASGGHAKSSSGDCCREGAVAA